MAEVNEDTQSSSTFSWRDPHPIFVIFFVGPEEVPFGIQLEFLCAHSKYYKDYFDKPAEEGDELEAVENLVKLPDITPEVFGLIQHFLFTGRLLPETDEIPGYEILIATWNAAAKFEISKLSEKVLEAMVDYRRIHGTIPATPLLVQAWQATAEGSNIRQLLLNWTAEYIRSSDSRAEFTKTLPQEVLSELVVAMSQLKSAPAVQADPVPSPARRTYRKRVHYPDAADNGESSSKALKHLGTADAPSKRHSLGGLDSGSHRPSREATKPKRASTSALPVDIEFTAEQKLNFCRDLLKKMVVRPGVYPKGYWQRYCKPFRQPVDPVIDEVPDYFEKISKPMDLSTMSIKMDRNEYANADEFLADMRQIFTNCYTYWPKGSPMWEACQKFEEHFEDKYATIYKVLAKEAKDDLEGWD